MRKIIQRLLFAYRYKKAVRQADEFKKNTGLKHMVIVLNGSPKVAAKKDLCHLIRTRKFRKGTHIRDIERKALYTTL